MHAHPIESWRHEHVFLGADHLRNERRTRIVVGLTLLMMVAEIAAGSIYGSMALLADGWHMATHAGALTVSSAAYVFARRHARSERFAFGTGKVGDLAGFGSALILACIAAVIGYESVVRLVQPSTIRFDEAIVVAVIGLLVNLASAALLGHAPDDHHHDHDHEHDHDHAPHGEEAHAPVHSDLNLRSAHLHVLADAMTSVFAIAALGAGRLLGWNWMDAVCGIVGAAVILYWSFGLLRDTGAVLLDVDADPGTLARIRSRIEAQRGDRVTDLHVWRVGPGHLAAIVSVVTDALRPPEHYKQLLAGIGRLAHVTVEVQLCPGDHSPAGEAATPQEPRPDAHPGQR